MSSPPPPSDQRNRAFSPREGSPIQPETEAERQRRHAASLEAYRRLVDPAAPPRAPFLFEQHFFAGPQGNVSGLTEALEAKGYQIETFAYNPESQERTWEVVALKVDLLEERRVLALSDEMEMLARQHDCVYDGWLTRVD